MKNITGTIIQTDNQPYANKKISFALQDRYERNVAAMSKDGQIIASQEVTTDEGGNFSVFLESLDAFKFDYFYKMSFEKSVAPLKLYVYGRLALEVDYKKCLLKQPRLDMFYEFVEVDRSFVFDDAAILLLDMFFVGENRFYKQEHHNLINTFNNYADGKIYSDAMRALDNHLGVIVSMLSPSYIASEMMVNEAVLSNRLLAASSLIDALGDLGRLKADTQGLISDGLSKAIREAKKAALVMS